MSSYNTPEGKFNEVSSNDWTIFDYGTTIDFRKKVDISVAGVIMDCGECHVGGGAMEYVPFKKGGMLTHRTPLRELTTGPDAAAIAAGNLQAAVSVDEKTAFNFFIDTYDADLDGNEEEMMYIDYANTGVMEMDCLLCHLPGYNYAERTYLLRRGKIGATRAVGAGFATENALNWSDSITDAATTTFDAAPVGYGTTVNYNTDIVVSDITFTSGSGTYVIASGQRAISGDWFNENLAAKPDSANCAFCHMSKPSVDWKKRGDNWPGTYVAKFASKDEITGDPIVDGTGNAVTEEHSFVVPLDAQYEVHQNIGCMGCHERKPTALQPEPFDYTGADGYSTQGVGLLGHDPAKGHAPFSSVYNNSDHAGFKTCKDCHSTGVIVYEDTDGDMIPDTAIASGKAYGAPNASAAHAAYGLTAKIVQAKMGSGTTLDGQAAISHIDLMACSTCHSRKIDNGTWHNNGNPMVDATGNDVAGRLTDHENEAVIKQDMTDNSGLSWHDGQLIRASYLNTMFWRDNGSNTSFDANMDGSGGGMDAILMTQVNKMNEAAGDTSLTGDAYDDQLLESVVSATDINTRVTALNAVLDAWVDTGGTADVKLSMMHVAFKDQHGVSPASMAWGSGKGNDSSNDLDADLDDNINPCMDCHSINSNFWNGSINTVGDRVDISWDNDVVPFTKVNGMTQPTDMHPNVKDRFGKRSLASSITTTHPTDPTLKTTRSLPIAETVYEATFQTLADYAQTRTGGAIDFTKNEAGYMIFVEVIGDDDSYKRYTKKVTANVANAAALVTHLGSFADNSNGFNFTITASGTDALILAAVDTTVDYSVRLGSGSHAGPLKLTNATFKPNPWTGVDSLSYAGRDAWVTYLNTLFVDVDGVTPTGSPADYGIGQDPVAAIATIDAIASVDANDDSVGDAVITVALDATSGEATVEMIADTAGNSTATSFNWICNDTADETKSGSTVSKTFDTVGTWMVTLNVIDEEGKLAQYHQDVVVTAPVSTMGFVPGVEEGAGVTTAQTVVFNGLPTGSELDAMADQLYVIWGDGDREIITNTINNPVAQGATHQFRAYDMYLDGAGNYEYNIIVRAEDVIDTTDMWGNPTTETVVLGMASFTFTVTDDIP